MVQPTKKISKHPDCASKNDYWIINGTFLWHTKVSIAIKNHIAKKLQMGS